MKKTAGKASEAVKTKPLPRTSPSSKMSLNHLRPPPEMKIPSRVELKQSTVDENCLGQYRLQRRLTLLWPKEYQFVPAAEVYCFNALSPKESY